MGKATKAKQAKEEEAAQKVASILLSHPSTKNRTVVTRPQEEFSDDVQRYSQWFVRTPESFVSKLKSADQAKRRIEYAKHLFVRYRVPRIFDKVWNTVETAQVRLLRRGQMEPGRAPTANNGKYRRWFVTLASGGSLYKLHTKGLLTKQETHLLLTCPYENMDINRAIFWAVSKAAGADSGTARKISESKIGEHDSDSGLFEFWANCARFFAAAPDTKGLTIQQLSDLTDFLVAQRQQDRNYSIFGHGFTIASLQKRMVDWHYELRRTKDLSGYEWPGHDIPDFEYETQALSDERRTGYWKLIQIKSGKDLAAEGTAQRHCVYSYKNGCMNGDHSIWTLRYSELEGDVGSRKLTIQLYNSGNVGQMRGLANRMPRPEEINVVARWCKENGLTMARYY